MLKRRTNHEHHGRVRQTPHVLVDRAGDIRRMGGAMGGEMMDASRLYKPEEQRCRNCDVYYCTLKWFIPSVACACWAKKESPKGAKEIEQDKYTTLEGGE